MQRFALTASFSFLATLLSAVPAQASPGLNSDITRNPSAATGRSGNASLLVRALLSKDGNAILEATTGELDGDETAPGNIAKLQIKGFDGEGNLWWAQNENGLNEGGHVVRTFDHFDRGQPYQVQANVKGIDGNRTNVITVTGNVKLRPDLAVRDVDAPAEAFIGAPVNVSAHVSELNGDVGASASCLLLVDGVETDRSEGIWVDAGTGVTCLFTVEIADEGTHDLDVVVADVEPGDWDAANNAASTSISIVSPSQPLSWSAYVTGYQYDHEHYRSEGWRNYDYDSGDTTHTDWSNEQTYSRDEWISTRFSGWNDTYIGFPFSVMVSQSTAGETVHSFDVVDHPADYSYDDGTNRYAGLRINFEDSDDAGKKRRKRRDYLHIYSEEWDGVGYASVSYLTTGGGYTYFSRDYYSSWYQYPGEDPVYTHQRDITDDVEGDYGVADAPQVWGATYDFDVAVSGDTNTVAATVQVPVSSQLYESSTPWECTDYDQDNGNYIYQSHRCYEEDYAYTQYSGSASG
jgi:hypothetical protein